MTSCTKVFDRFELKIEEAGISKLGVQYWEKMKEELLESAIGMIMADDLRMEHSLTNYDADEKTFADNLNFGEIEVLALYMVVAWYEPKVNSLEHTTLFFGSKDEKWTDQRNHLKAISDIQEKYRRRARKYIRNYSSRNNSYLNGGEGNEI